MCRSRTRSEQGASLVEFAILAPLLVLLLLGIVEFGWLFAQNLDISHGAREGARLAATNFAGDLPGETCARMNLVGGGNVELDITQTGTEIGDSATVTVTLTPDSLTGLFSGIIPGTIDAVVETRLEQTATWAVVTGHTC